MKTNERRKHRKINFEVKQVYVGKKAIGEVFEEVIEHIVERNLENTKKEKQTQAINGKIKCPLFREEK